MSENTLKMKTKKTNHSAHLRRIHFDNMFVLEESFSVTLRLLIAAWHCQSRSGASCIHGSTSRTASNSEQSLRSSKPTSRTKTIVKMNSP